MNRPRQVQLFGVNCRTGRYALPPLSSEELEVAALRAVAKPALVAEARRTLAERELANFEAVMGPTLGSSVRGGRRRGRLDFDLPEWEVSRRGWGVVFPSGDPRLSAMR